MSTTPDAILLEVGSVLGTAHLVLRVDGARVRLTTFVQYEQRATRVVWPAIAPLHRRIIPYLLRHTAAEGEAGGA